jgi:hypothetical protein
VKHFNPVCSGINGLKGGNYAEKNVISFIMYGGDGHLHPIDLQRGQRKGVYL